MKKLTLVTLIIAMLVSLAACGSSGGGSESQAESESTSGSGMTIEQNPNAGDGKNILGIAWSNLAAEATQKLVAHYEEVYKDYGWDELIVVQADNNVETQISQIQDLANQGVDMMIVNSVDPDGIVAAVDSVMAMGIPVVAVDRRINTDIYYTLETDNTQCGRDVAKMIAAMTLPQYRQTGEKVQIITLPSNMTSSAVRDRMTGFEEEIAYWSHIDVVQSTSCESSIEKCYDAVIDAYKTNPDIAAIFVTGDNYVAPAVSALNEMGRLKKVGEEGHVIIGSIDGATSALEYLLSGDHDIVANQRFDLFCTQALKVCQDYMNGTYVDPTDNDDKLLTPIITIDNIESLNEEGLLWGYPEG